LLYKGPQFRLICIPGVLGRSVVHEKLPQDDPGDAEGTGQVEHRVPAQVLDDDGGCHEGRNICNEKNGRKSPLIGFYAADF
jgi:hypothetical protein